METQDQHPGYHADYKHFDNLIWQLPVWSTAIFLLAITGVAYISTANFTEIAPGVKKSNYIGIVLLVCFFFQLAVFNALIRFRDHQRDLANKDIRAFAKWWYSGQTWLQFAVIGQTCALFYFSLNVFKVIDGLWPSITLGVVLFFYSVLSVYFKVR